MQLPTVKLTKMKSLAHNNAACNHCNYLGYFLKLMSRNKVNMSTLVSVLGAVRLGGHGVPFQINKEPLPH